MNFYDYYTPSFQPISEVAQAPPVNRSSAPVPQYGPYRPAKNQMQLAVIPSSDDSDSSPLDALTNGEDPQNFQGGFVLQPSLNSFLEECGLPPLALDQMTYDTKDSIV